MNSDSDHFISSFMGLVLKIILFVHFPNWTKWPSYSEISECCTMRVSFVPDDPVLHWREFQNKPRVFIARLKYYYLPFTCIDSLPMFYKSSKPPVHYSFEDLPFVEKIVHTQPSGRTEFYSQCRQPFVLYPDLMCFCRFWLCLCVPEGPYI